MKVILDEWIVREVIDTLYMARATLLGITGLDSPQEIAKKSANQTAITRRIIKAIDIIKQSEQPHSSKSLEEAAEEYYQNEVEETKCHHASALTYAQGYEDALLRVKEAFIAGAEWQQEQKCHGRFNRDEVFMRGMKYAKEQMMKEAIEGFIFQVEDYYPKELIAQYRGEDLKHGDKVKLYIFPKDESK